jgi:cytochrome c
MTHLSTIGPLIVLSWIASLGAASAEEKDSQLAFNNNCRQCHTVKEGDNRLGPSLYGIVGKKAGTATSFAYSDSLKSSGITWDEATLDKWIADPESVITNNKMKPYTGMTDASARAAIIAFLKQGTENGEGKNK